MARNTGKFIEKQVGKALTSMLGKECVAVRLHDTKSAAFFLPPSPADFMGLFKGGIPVIIEAKSSDENTTFTDCRVKDYVKPTQYAYHKMWINMGGVSMFIFHSILTKTVEFWDGKTVLEAYVDKWKDWDHVTHSTGQSAKDIQPMLLQQINQYKVQQEDLRRGRTF